MKRAHMIVLGGIVAAFIAGGVAWHQLTKPSIENDEVDFYIAAAQPIYSRLARIPVVREASRAGMFEASLVEALHAAEVVGALKSSTGNYEIVCPPDLAEKISPKTLIVTEAMHKSLIAEVSGLLSRRFAVDDPDHYITYRAGQDAILSRARFDKHFPGLFEAMSQRVAGPTGVAGATPESLFRTVFDRHIPHEIAVGEGMAIAYGIDTSAFAYSDLSEASLGYTAWSGGLSVGYPPQTTLPYTRNELLARYSHLPCAYVGFITYYPDRSPRPLALWFNWHPAESRWVLMRVMLMNLPRQEAMSAMFPEF